MLKFTKDSYVDVDKYKTNLIKDKFIYFDRERGRRILNYDMAKKDTMIEQALRIIKADTGNTHPSIDKENVIDYLIDYHRVPETKFKAKNVQGRSLSKDKVLQPLYDNNIAKEFLTPYMSAQSLKHNNGTMEKLLQKMTGKTYRNKYGDELRKLYFKVEQQVNLRFNYKETAIVNIPTSYNECISAPEGRIIAQADFKQSDFRIAYNLFIRDEANAKIMDACDDKYEGMSRIIAIANNEEFDLDKFKSERDLYKVYTLATIYGRRTGYTKEANAFIRKLAAYLDTCPRYKEYYTRLRDAFKLGLPITVTSYFGHREIAVYNPYKEKDTINFALNSPIQTGTSEIIILTVNAILDKFYALGYTEDDISVYYVRHDEPIFIMKESVMIDSWVFEECSKILVDNWTPLEMEFSFGYRYYEESEDIMTLYKDNCRINKYKITQIEQDTSTDYSYYPVPKTMTVGVASVKLPNNNTIITIYSETFRACHFALVNGTNEDEVQNAIRTKFKVVENKLVEEGYKTALIQTENMNIDDYYNEIYVKYEINTGALFQKAEILAYYMADRYCKGNNIEFDIPPQLLANFDLAKTVRDFAWFNTKEE